MDAHIHAKTPGSFGTAKATAWEVEITSSNIGHDTKGAKYTYYNITLKAAATNTPVHVVRRYRQFFAFYQQLLEDAPAVLHELRIDFPKKKVFGRFRADFRERRRCALLLFLRKVLSDQYLLTLSCTRRFFNSAVNEHGRLAANPHASRDIPDLLLSDS